MQAASGWWDVLSHRKEFTVVDPPLNPAHLGLYMGTLMLWLGILLFGGLRRESRGEFFAYFLAGSTQISGAILNEFIHRFTGLEQSPLHFAVHSTFAFGMLLYALALFLRVSLKLACEDRSRYLLATLILAGCSLWLLSAGPVMYLFGQPTPFMTGVTFMILSFIASSLINTVLASSRAVGTSFLMWLVFETVVYVLVVGYLGYPPYLPVAVFILPPILLAGRYLAKRGLAALALMLVGGLIGLTSRAIYYPLSLYYTNPLTVEELAWASVGGLLGSATVLTGARFITATLSRPS